MRTTTAMKTSPKKTQLAFFQTLSPLFGPAQFVNCRRFLVFRTLFRSSKWERKIRRRMFTSCIKFRITVDGFTSQSCSGRQRNVLKSVMHVRSYFSHKTNCCSTLSLLSSWWLLKLPIPNHHLILVFRSKSYDTQKRFIFSLTTLYFLCIFLYLMV